MNIASIVFVCASVSVALAGQDDRRLAFEEHFGKPHAKGSLEEIGKRLSIRKRTMLRHDPDAKEGLGKPEFFAYVPKEYAADGTWGVLVWISPADQGNCAVSWPKTLGKHKLLHIGAHASGNDRFVWYRIGFALMAVRFMTERYKIDPDRVYVMGHSGGGRVATTLAMHWADVFKGGVYANGANHFAAIKKPGARDLVWPAKIKKPTGKRLRLARLESRHVFVNGERDFNLVHSKAVQKDLAKKHGFKRTSLIVMKDYGHGVPEGEWLSKCITALDAPLFAARKKAADKAKKRAAKKQAATKKR